MRAVLSLDGSWSKPELILLGVKHHSLRCGGVGTVGLAVDRGRASVSV